MRIRTSSFTLALLAAAASGLLAAADPTLLARWTLEKGSAASSVGGVPAGQVERAKPGPGRAGAADAALIFEDWSARNYLKPDPKEATRVVIPHDAKLNPRLPFRLTAWIRPTADPVFQGGIAEKGRGFGASYRLLLLRGLKVEACLGDKHVCARSAEPLSLNAWHEVTLVAETGRVVLRVDGKESAQTPIEGALKISSSDPLILGDRFTGAIAEVSIETD